MNIRRSALACCALVISFSLLKASIACAEGGPHGDYATTTAACAACHRTHSSAGPTLNAFTTQLDLCLSCHDGTGSIYAVTTGEIKVGAGAAPSAAGPLRPTSAGGLATSSHALGQLLDPPGGQPAAATLSCEACHDPHGSSNHRLFRTAVTWNGLNVPVTFTATVAQRGTLDEQVIYMGGSVQACTACHPDYARRTGGNFSKGTRHRVNVKLGAGYTPGELPLERGQLVCLSCHYAHGTTVINTTASGLSGMSTSLKRRSDWSVCSQCHFNRP